MDTMVPQKIMTLQLHRIRNRYFFLTLIIGALFFVPLFSLAQNSIALSVSPTIFEMTANPGQQWESTLRVINTNPFPLTVYASVVNFKPLGEDGSSQFSAPDTSDDVRSSLAEWISVPNGELVIPPEQTLQIPIVINPPIDTPPGGHYAAVLVGTRPPQGTQGTVVETSQFVSSLIFLRVAGDVVESGTIRSFTTDKAIYESPTASFQLRFQNTGNVHVLPEGEIRIFNMWGQERGFIPINQKTLFGKVLSDSTRTFTFTWSGEWSPTDIGRYKAIATLAYGEDSRKFTSSETAFWIIPWRVVLAIVFVISLIGYGVSWLLKLYVRRMLSLAGLSDSPLRNQVAATRRTRRTVSVMAPIEAGILDLRSRFIRGQHPKRTGKALWEFCVQYRLFFAGVGIVLISIGLIMWFFSSATDKNRSYEVTIDRIDADVTLNSEQIIFQQLQSEVPTVGALRDVPPILVVNRSGVSGAAAVVAQQLAELGYDILDVEIDTSSANDKTVVVFDAQYDDDALDLSIALNGALLSAYTPTSADPFLVVYVGKDIAVR